MAALEGVLDQLKSFRQQVDRVGDMLAMQVNEVSSFSGIIIKVLKNFLISNFSLVFVLIVDLFKVLMGILNFLLLLVLDMLGVTRELIVKSDHILDQICFEN